MGEYRTIREMASNNRPLLEKAVIYWIRTNTAGSHVYYLDCKHMRATGYRQSIHMACNISSHIKSRQRSKRESQIVVVINQKYLTLT